MKKFLVVLVVLAVMVTGVFAGTNDSGTVLTVYGEIKEGEFEFKVTPSEKEVIDLANNVAIRPGGGGVKVGAWSFVASSKPANTSYTIGYELTKLISASTGREFVFKVLETIVEGDEDYGSKTILFSGSTNIETNILVELEAGEAVGPTDVPADDFEGTITITLTAVE